MLAAKGDSVKPMVNRPDPSHTFGWGRQGSGRIWVLTAFPPNKEGRITQMGSEQTGQDRCVCVCLCACVQACVGMCTVYFCVEVCVCVCVCVCVYVYVYICV